MVVVLLVEFDVLPLAGGLNVVIGDALLSFPAAPVGILPLSKPVDGFVLLPDGLKVRLPLSNPGGSVRTEVVVGGRQSM